MAVWLGTFRSVIARDMKQNLRDRPSCLITNHPNWRSLSRTCYALDNTKTNNAVNVLNVL